MMHIVFDIGGTKTRVARVSGGALHDIRVFETSFDPDEGVQKLKDAIRAASGGMPMSGIVGGIKGIIHNGVVNNPPHIVKWNGLPLQELLSREFGVGVSLFNDTELVALGEYRYGAGKGERDMLYVTVSTGVGGAHIVDGRIDKGKYNVEIGHQLVEGEELERRISGSAVAKKYGVSPVEADASAMALLADILAKGLYDNVLHWSPDVIVLGGSMIVGKNPIPIERVATTLTSLVTQYYPEAPKVLKATLGDHGGLYGGMAVVESRKV